MVLSYDEGLMTLFTKRGSQLLGLVLNGILLRPGLIIITLVELRFSIIKIDISLVQLANRIFYLMATSHSGLTTTQPPYRWL